jgi:hypothetical protein
MEPEASAKKTKIIAGAIVLVVVVAVAALVLSGSGGSKDVPNIESLDDLGLRAAEVPSANPLRQVAPAENPLEKTNPFKNEYQNPFE